MGNVLSILGRGGKILLYVLVGISSLLILLFAYTLLAPDSFPKPFQLPALNSTESASAMPESTPEPTATPTQCITPGSGVMVDTGTKIINLAEVSGNKYIRIDVVLEFAQPNGAETAPASSSSGEGGDTTVVTAADQLANDINARMPMINDTIITLLSSKTYGELYTALGKEALRGELMQKLQAVLPDYQIIGIYFTEFVVE